MDLFENTVLCKHCGKKMKPAEVEKNGFKMRALHCPSCSNCIIHPVDVEEYNKFKLLSHRQFQVKLRLVGNSYTVSIPREIINFMQESDNEIENLHSHIHEKMSNQMQEMQNFVTLAMEEANKLSLMFNQEQINTKNEDTLGKQKFFGALGSEASGVQKTGKFSRAPKIGKFLSEPKVLKISGIKIKNREE